TWSIRSKSFKRWLRRLHYETQKRAPNAETLETAIGALEARAQFDGDRRSVFLRVADHAGNIYIDLCDEAWRIAKVSPGGWRIIPSADAPCRFRRSHGMLALPEPASGGAVNELRRHLNMRDDAYVLTVSWLLAALRGRGPYPILAIDGEQGTGKSTAARM